MKKGFTLLELIIVIVILGILATLGYTQYSRTVESARLAEAKARIGLMRQLAYEYYLKNGTLVGVSDSDVGADNTCTSEGYFKYYAEGYGTATNVHLFAERCTSGGKTPNATSWYRIYYYYFPASGSSSWRCQNAVDSSGCFGYPH